MSFDFELSKFALDRANKRAQSIIDEVRDSLKDGSGRMSKSLNIYNKYQKGEPISAKQYEEDRDVREEVDRAVSLILATKWEIDRIFDVDIEDKDAVKVTDVLFYQPELEEQLEDRVKHYQMVLHAIKTAHTLTDAQLKTTAKTLDALGVDMPREMKIILHVRENYAKNQLKTALADAVETIFPSINNKIILDQITAKALH